MMHPTQLAYADSEPVLIKMRATAYDLKGVTASGDEARPGICASGHKEWIGKTIVMYQRNGEEIGDFIGIYECLDTGCNDNVIDVWNDVPQDFMNIVYRNGCQGKIWVQILDAEG